MRYLILAVLVGFIVCMVGCGGSGKGPPAGYSVRDGWVTKPSGLQYKDVKIGSGDKAISGDTLLVNYTGTLDNGTVFDTSIGAGKSPLQFVLGNKSVIDGWEEGLLGVRAGGKCLLIVPANLGYGAQGKGNIPPNATLHFEVDIVAIY